MKNSGADELAMRGRPCFEAVAPESWIDMMKHVNIQYYMRMVERGVERWLADVLGSAADAQWRVHETKIIYRSEMKVGARIEVFVRPLKRTENSITLLARIYQVEPEQKLSAECEWIGRPIGMGEGSGTALDEATKSAFDLDFARYASDPYEREKHSAPGSVYPDAESKTVFSTEGVIEKDWVDSDGRVDLENFTRLNCYANHGFLKTMGAGMNFAEENNLGLFALETGIEYLGDLAAGDRYRVMTFMKGYGRKVTVYQHKMFREGDEPVLVARCDHTLAYAKMDERRLIELPEEFLGTVRRVWGEPISDL